MNTLLLATATQTERTWAGGVTIAAGSLATAALLGWAWYEWRSKGRQLLLVLLLGSAVSFFVDPAFQRTAGIVLGAPTSASPGVYHLLGVYEALWCLFVYPMWISFITYLGYLALEEGWHRRRFWTVFAAMSLADVVAEVPSVRFGLYTYTGQQPFRLWGFPLIWAPNYMAMGLLLGAALHFLTRAAPGWRSWLALPMVASGYLGLCFVTGWPIVLAAHHTFGEPLVSLFGLAALAAQLATLQLIASQLPSDGALPASTHPAGVARHAGEFTSDQAS
ncbi:MULTISPECIES: hypothetical protein [Streptacidiphilus]|uniref:Carotenoid biosynthesis protein n=1 Tax=Streptacidiphilus cavernicola TaxID=3342716 RepID=A0ABV6UNR0_9ACTN|nr:hypothetical protein [Streptacidiphilus jeojiense]